MKADSHHPPAPRPVSRPVWLLQVEKLRRLPRWIRVTVLVSSTLLIGCMDHIAGRGSSLFVFYALPIMLMTWLVNRQAGLWLAVLSGPVWWFANDVSIIYPSTWRMIWLTLSRITYFVFIALGTAALRTKQETDEAQIELLKEMRHLEMEIVNSREREQQRIGQDLHDGLCQQLAAIGCAAKALADDLHARGVMEAQDAERIGAALDQSVIEARGLAGGMSSLHVERGGLAAALATLVQTTNRLTGVPVRLHALSEVYLDDHEAATHLYRIAQEALGNAVRHSGAKDIVVRLEKKSDRLELRIDDDGRGLPEKTRHRITGIGLETMRYRAHAMGADLIIHPRSGGGTSVRCHLPLQKQFASAAHASS